VRDQRLAPYLTPPNVWNLEQVLAAEALTAATAAPAAAFALTDRGRIAVGLRADLLLVNGDPTASIQATRDIVAVWKAGVSVDRDRSRVEVVQAPRITISARAGGELDQPPFAIIPPAPDLPATLAAFSGVWEGKWESVLRSRLIVEQVNLETAAVIYVWDNDALGQFPRGWVRITAAVLPGPALQWHSGSRFTFTMAEDAKSIRGTREVEDIAVVVMTKMKP
jgi:hypothetical protein